MNAKNITKEDVIAELRSLQSEGHSMKIGDFDSWLKYEIKKHFGGYKNAKRELSIGVRKLPGGGRKSRYKDEEVKALLERLLAEGRASDYVYDKHKDVIDWFHHNHGGGLARACLCYGIAKFERPKVTNRKKKWTDERMAEEIQRLDKRRVTLTSNHLKTLGYNGLVSAVKKRYGSWNGGLRQMGIEVTYETQTKHKTSEEMIAEIKDALLKGAKPTSESLRKEIRGFGNWLIKLFGSFEEMKSQAGFCAITDRPKKEAESDKSYRANLSSPDGFKREITRLYYVGSPLNYTAVKRRRSHLIEAANTLFGTWREALEYCGFDYDDIVVSDNILSECGTDFEDILGDLLTEIGITFAKYSHEKFDPDFVLPDGHWLDAKLSEWTDTSEMLKRYLPECESLTIVYLRGAKEERQRGYKYPHKTVSAYLLADKLPEERRKHYYEKFTEIENKANAGEIGSHSA